MPTPRKPTSLKRLDGETRPSQLNLHEPRPRPITPDPPCYLAGEALTRWHELLPELEAIGTVTRIDGDILAGYCTAYGDVVALTGFLAANERTYSVGTNGALAARPEVAMLNRAWDHLRKFGAELGIGAASRSRISVEKRPADGLSPLERVRQVTRRKT